MIDICEFLEVKDADSATDVIIENCADYHAALSAFVLVLPENNIPLVKNWIIYNMRNNQEHCTTMLEKDPVSIFHFFMRMRRLEHCTSEFVHDAGGIQQFIDKYSWPKDIREQEAADSSSKAKEESVSEESQKTEVCNEPETAVQLDHASISEDDMHELTVCETANAMEEEKENADSGQIIARLTEAEHVTCNQNAAPPVPVVSETETSAVQGIVEPTTSEPVGAASEQVQVIGRKTIIQEEVIHRKVREIIEYEPDLIDKISENQIAASLQKLRELNNQIALGGLDPKLILSDSDLSEIYKKVYTYPPDVFKAFILAYLRSVSSETERFRLSAVIDDFVNFVSR